MAKTEKKHGGTILCVVLIAIVVAFFVTSVVLADIHEVSLVTEWQTWFGIAKKATETPPGEIVETTKVVVIQPLKALIAC